jgi:peptide/nickel transport system permease protein
MLTANAGEWLDQPAGLNESGTRLHRVGRFIWRHRGLFLGLALLGLLVFVCLAAPLLTPYNPTQDNFSAVLQPPSGSHLFGTDQYGRDVFSRTLYAGRIDFLIGLVLVGVASIVGTAMGMLSGWFGGVVDTVIMRIVDVGLAFPFLVLVISIVGLRGPGLGSLFLAVCLVAWIFYARLVRGQVLTLRSSNFILSARMSDFSTARILSRHLFPNVVSQVVVYASSDFVYAVLLGASVSYLGLGVQPPTPEWGAMIQSGQDYITSQWWLTAFPGLAIVLVGIAFSLIGDGLADLLRVGQAA